MSLALLQSYSSAEEDELVHDEHLLQDQISSDDDANDAVPKTRSYKPLFDPNPLSSSSLPSAFDAFSEIAGPPQFLNNSVDEDPQKGAVQQWRHGSRKNRKDKKHLPSGAVVESKAQLVGIGERVRSDVENTTPQGQAGASVGTAQGGKRVATVGNPNAEDAAELLRFKNRQHISSSAFQLHQIYMAGHEGAAGAGDGRTHIWVQDSIFMPDNGRVVRFITSRFALQTCDEGYSWKYVTEEQRTWYWDEFVKRYRWDEESAEAVRTLWYSNVATLYRRTIHGWRTTGRFPPTVSQTRWDAWTAAWQDQGWLDRAGKNRVNRSAEPAGRGTGTSKHIAGSKTYSAHYQSMRADQGTDPTSWDLYLHTHMRSDGSFVDERSRLVNQSLNALWDESLTPLEDGTIPDQPSSEEVNSMFKSVVGGKKKGRIYGCGSMASTIYPQEMAPRARGGGSSSSQDSQNLRETVQRQGQMVDFLREDLQASQRRETEREQMLDSMRADLQASQRRETEREQENQELRSRLYSLEEQMQVLVSGLPRVPSTQRARHSGSRVMSSTGRSVSHSYRRGPAGASSSRPVPGRGKVLRPPFDSQQWDFDGDDDDDDGGAYDDDETQAP